MFALATIFFSIRMVVKYLRFTAWGADDTWLAIGFLLLAVQEHYILIIAIIKASILAFFLRIFPDERFKRVIWCTLVVDLLVGFLCFLLGIVQRVPTWLIWEGWKSKEPLGVVLDLNNLGLAHGGMNVVLDAWMLVLPFTQLYKLNHPLRKKLGIFAMFSVGIFLTIVGAIRVHNLSTFATSRNITNDVLEGVIWSCIEVCVGVVVACMPHTRQLFREATRKLRRPARPLASIERTGRLHWRQPRARRDDSVESATAVGSQGAGAAPVDKSWYSSTTQSAYTTTTCTSDRQPSSFASDATTRFGSVGQVLDETAASRLKTPGEKPESRG
ncbi:hypothetical protein SLS63_001767 [Diaporthe eres]|uniref:Rhodopsin domain-containing protein n=1 Tax=Diaporthe eres TaxID=83184 RepID=A0ABR1PL66_DIAER